MTHKDKEKKKSETHGAKESLLLTTLIEITEAKIYHLILVFPEF
jgi:hypothetical protein